MTHPTHNTRITSYFQVGFTLVELSIVMIIIGLITGAVMAGKSLVEAAKVQGTVQQLSEIESAHHTFALKYDALPGDIKASDAALLNLAARSGAIGQGNGDGVLQAALFKDVQGLVTGELTLYWNDLSKTQLLQGSYIGLGANPAMTETSVKRYIPETPLKMHVAIHADYNYLPFYFLSRLLAVNPAGVTSSDPYGGIIPSQAEKIDSKIDDGMPDTGIVQIRPYYNPLEWAGTHEDCLFSPCCLTLIDVPNDIWGYARANQGTTCHLRIDVPPS